MTHTSHVKKFEQINICTCLLDLSHFIAMCALYVGLETMVNAFHGEIEQLNVHGINLLLGLLPCDKKQTLLSHYNAKREDARMICIRRTGGTTASGSLLEIRRTIFSIFDQAAQATPVLACCGDFRVKDVEWAQAEQVSGRRDGSRGDKSTDRRDAKWTGVRDGKWVGSAWFATEEATKYFEALNSS